MRYRGEVRGLPPERGAVRVLKVHVHRIPAVAPARDPVGATPPAHPKGRGRAPVQEQSLAGAAPTGFRGGHDRAFSPERPSPPPTPESLGRRRPRGEARTQEILEPRVAEKVGGSRSLVHHPKHGGRRPGGRAQPAHAQDQPGNPRPTPEPGMPHAPPIRPRPRPLQPGSANRWRTGGNRIPAKPRASLFGSASGGHIFVEPEPCLPPKPTTRSSSGRTPKAAGGGGLCQSRAAPSPPRVLDGDPAIGRGHPRGGGCDAGGVHRTGPPGGPAGAPPDPGRLWPTPPPITSPAGTFEANGAGPNENAGPTPCTISTATRRPTGGISAP